MLTTLMPQFNLRYDNLDCWHQGAQHALIFQADETDTLVLYKCPDNFSMKQVEAAALRAQLSCVL